MGIGQKGKTAKLSRRWYNPDSLLLNIVVAVFCVLGMGSTLWLFRADLNRTLRSLAEEPVGTLVWKNYRVQRLSAGRYLWDRPRRYARFYDGDVITTAAFSQARVVFVNGEILELSENTSVRLVYRNEEISRFDLIEGAVSLTSSRFTAAVFTGSGKVNLNPKSSASVRTGTGINLSVFQGSASLTAGEETHRAEAGEALETGGDGEFLGEPRVVMVFPQDGTRILNVSKEPAPVEFIWQKVNAPESSGVRLEIAGDRDFTRPVVNWYGEDNAAAFDLAPGIYYWRAFVPPALDSVKPGLLEIRHFPGFRALSPADGSVFRYVSRTPELRFSWSAPEEVSELVLEVADNPDMERVRFRQELKSAAGEIGSFTYSELREGSWYWRVRPVYSGLVKGDGLPSSVNSFRIVRDAELSAPVPITPPALINTGQGNIRFSWSPDDEAVSYTLLVSRDRELRNPLISQTTDRNYYIYDISQGTLEEGEYYWGVYLTGTEDRRSAVSEALSFTVSAGETNPRTLFPPDNYTATADRSPDINFSWKNPYSRGVRFQIAERPDFSASLIRDEEIKGLGAQGRFLKPGVYYWRVSADAGLSGKDSPPARLVILPSLPEPAIQSPKENDNLLAEDGKPVIFSWERMDYAYYRFSIYAEGRNEPLTDISSLRDNQVTVFFDARTAGRFRWTVQGFKLPTADTSGRSGPIVSGRFTVSPTQGTVTGNESWGVPRIAIQIIPGETHSAITLESPKKDANILGLDALRTPPEARWTSDEPLQNIRLIISRTLDPVSDPMAIVERARSADSAVFPALSEGTWYWTVRADTMDNRGVGPGTPFWFNVLPIPPLLAPEQPAPADEEVITLAQLTRDKNLTFRWNEVEGANAYIFSLSGGDPPRLLITGLVENRTSFVLEDLTLLDQDIYLWQVEAVYQNRNGILEQRGIIEQHPFSIDVQRSTNLQTRSQGKLYGQ
jgi:hypothetical protein